MNNLLIKVNKSDRSVTLSNNYIGNDGENLQEKLIFSFTDSFVNGVARLEYKIDDETYYVMLNKEGETYNLPITSMITKNGVIACQLVINEDGNNYPIFKSDEFLLFCRDSINAETPQPENYPTWIDSASVIVNEASNLNITSNIIENGVEIYFTNKQGATTKRVLYNGEPGPQGPPGPTPDLSDYVKNTDYASLSTAGVIKSYADYNFNVSNVGIPYASVNNYTVYENRSNNAFISKGTLENVITGKDLTTKTYVDSLVGDIGTILDSINNEVL